MVDKDTHDSKYGTTRRSLLKRTAATVSVGVGASGFTGSASAAPITERYADPLQTESVFESNANDLLSMLSSEGVLETDDLYAELHTRRPMGVSDMASKKEGTAYVEAANRPDEMVSVRHVDDGVLTVTVEPDTGRSYAIHDPDSEDAKYLFDVENGVRDVTIQCIKSCECSPYNCDSYAFTEVCTFRCSTGEYTDSSCGC